MAWFKRSVEKQLLEAKAELAEVKELPEGDFTIFRAPWDGGIIHGVARKQDVIARLKGKIAKLEILAEKEK